MAAICKSYKRLGNCYRPKRLPGLPNRSILLLYWLLGVSDAAVLGLACNLQYQPITLWLATKAHCGARLPRDPPGS